MGGVQVKYLLDTHVWIWWHSEPENVSVRVRRLLEDTGNYDELLLSAISPWEFAKLIEKGRIDLYTDPEEWMSRALQMPKLRLVPLTPRIAYCSTRLPGEFRGDPGDQIIIATARDEAATIITRDERIRKYRHVKTIW